MQSKLKKLAKTLGKGSPHGAQFQPAFDEKSNNYDKPTPAMKETGVTFNTLYSNKGAPDPTHSVIVQDVSSAEVSFKDMVCNTMGIKYQAPLMGGGDLLPPFDEAKFYQKIRAGYYAEDGSLRNDVKDSMDYGLQGLASYFHLCWAQELGAILRPDMIWTTVLSELARDAIRCPEKYRSTFAKGSQAGTKEDLLIRTNVVDDLDAKSIAKCLRDKLSSDDAFSLMCETSFSVETPGYTDMAASFLSAAASPYYNYISFMCGIPFVHVSGTADDWNTLSKACNRLKKYSQNKGFCTYLKQVETKVDEIRHYAFQCKDQDESNAFFGGCYWVTSNCGSGAPYYTCGWLSTFFYLSTGWGKYNKDTTPTQSFTAITDYPHNLAVVPWTNEETQRRFAKVSGLIYAKKTDNGFLMPHYGQITYEIVNKSLKL